MRISGLILAGGRGRRMQGDDKGWIMLDSKPMIEIVKQRLDPQVDEIIINANRNIERYQQLSEKVVEDSIPDYQGPLAGILTGLNNCDTEFMVCVPCDCPFFPTDLVTQMVDLQQLTRADIVSVTDGQRTHPVFALINTTLKQSLYAYLHSGQRKIDHWYQQHNYKLLEYPQGQRYFENINTPEQLQMAEQLVTENG